MIRDDRTQGAALGGQPVKVKDILQSCRIHRAKCGKDHRNGRKAQQPVLARRGGVRGGHGLSFSTMAR